MGIPKPAGFGLRPPVLCQAELAPCEVPKPGSECFKVVKPPGSGQGSRKGRYRFVGIWICRYIYIYIDIVDVDI